MLFRLIRPSPLATILGLVIAANAEKLDPILNYCARFNHQSTVKNGILYIYGGSETFTDFNDGVSPRNTGTVGYNEYMISVNLTFSWDWKVNISEKATNITANPNTGTLPPQAVRGTLYQGPSSDSNIYLYGGTTDFSNTSFPGWQDPVSSAYSLWSYDTKSTRWSQYDIEKDAPLRPSSGAAAEAADQNLAFYLNGEMDRGSSQYIGIVAGTSVFLEGMVVIDTATKTAKNISTSEINGGRARARAQMQYVPGIGEKGALVLLGGSSFQPNELSGSDIVGLVSMTEIDVFDVASLYNDSTPNGVWYKQNVTIGNGTDVPEPRVDFCLIVASAADSSSHNVYMYGGRDGANPPKYFDELWVLSLPSFTWTNVYTGISPRFSHTCHLVGNRTLLTVGGVATTSQMQGMFDLALDFGGCDWEVKGVGVLDISDLTWGSVYNVQATAYEVPQVVVAVIGGNTFGGATMKFPSSGFSQDGLSQMFGITPAKPPPKPANNRNNIIAGSMCGAAGLAVLIALAYYVRSRRKKHAPQGEQIHEKDVLPDSCSRGEGSPAVINA